MTERIAVETLTFSEISDLFKRSLDKALPKAKTAVTRKLKALEKAKVSRHKWVETYEIFKGAKIRFYFDKLPKKSVRDGNNLISNVGMSHRTTEGMILITLDVSNGGFSNGINRLADWQNWVLFYTAHFCERYAERIMKVDAPTFQIGAEAIMFSDIAGVAQVKDTISEGLDEIEFQFKNGLSIGYRDRKNKVTLLRTVISNDMLKGDQQEFRKEWELAVDFLNSYQWFRRDS